MALRLSSRQCVQCPSQPPACNCLAATQQCILSVKTCSSCPSFTCEDVSSNSGKSSGGVSKGAIAGGVVGSLLLIGLLIALMIWHNRRSRSRAQNDPVSTNKDTPAQADDVLNRPDPNEKLHQPAAVLGTAYSSAPPVYHQARALTGPDAFPRPSNRRSQMSNPFEDNHSIQTTSTNTHPNVIPIALVPRTQMAANGVRSKSPQRPLRNPELSLHPGEATGRPGDPTDSHAAKDSQRRSYMSGATFATDYIEEAPMIVTSRQGAVRQVVGVVKAEVVQAPTTAPTSPTSSVHLLKSYPPSVDSRPSFRSPLASSSFAPEVPAQYSQYQDDTQSDPFHDERGRPISVGTMATNVGTIIAEIGSVNRVQLGIGSLPSTATMPAMPPPRLSPARVIHRMTSGKLVTPPSGQSYGVLQDQQAEALALAQADLHRRVSGGSALSSTSTRADSILESFPFVPPSPISDRGLRTPTPSKSPLTQQAFSARDPPASTTLSTLPSATPIGAVPNMKKTRAPGPRVSQLSTASSGLGNFAFQIGEDLPPPPLPPSSFPAGGSKGRPPPRQRASLDTLALTSDLSSYPLGFDSAGMTFPPNPIPPSQ